MDDLHPVVVLFIVLGLWALFTGLLAFGLWLLGERKGWNDDDWPDPGWPSKEGERTEYDHCGDPVPEGYRAYQCPLCNAGCNFEAMHQCTGRTYDECPVMDGMQAGTIESNGDYFGFIERIE